jgi:hypothetical protein
MTPRVAENYSDLAKTYEMFSPDGKAHVVCPNCRAVIMLFEELTREQKREISEVSHSDKLIEAMDRLRAIAGCDLSQAKANVLHLRRADRCCHKCGTEVTAGSLFCRRCMSVNLDWNYGDSN